MVTVGPGDSRARLLESASEVLERFPRALRPEIYAVVPHPACRRRRAQTVRGGRLQHREPVRGRTGPGGPGEARWNYGRWILGGFEMLGNCPEDPVGGVLSTEEVRRLGLWFDGYGENAELDAGREPLGLHFADPCIRLAHDPHGGGRIEKVLG